MPNLNIDNQIKGKTLLITGGTGSLRAPRFFCFSAFMELNFSSHKVPLAMRMEKVYHKDAKSEIMRGDEHAFD